MDLIDTQWNVNILVQTQKPLHKTDLIDTQWNVNETSVRLFDDRKARFNRYIVECKYDGVDPNSIEEVDLIDTQWNVNMHQSH